MSQHTPLENDFKRKESSLAALINDTGQLYFSTPLRGVEKELEVPERAHSLDDYTIAELDKYQSGWDIVE